MTTVLALIAAAALGVLSLLLAFRLRRARREATRHFELSREMICVAGHEGRVESVSPAFERMLGVEGEGLLGLPLGELVDRNPWIDRQGEEHWLEWHTEELRDDGRAYAIARDVSDRRALELEVERLSQRDSLTGVFNRSRFDEELGARLSDARRHERGGALLLIDLDRFKRVNEELGRAAGDLALREVARVLDENTRGSDVVGRDAEGIVARVGGDEFAVLLSEVGPVEAAAVGKRLVAALETTELRFEGAEVPLAVSLGVAAYDGRDSLDPEGLMALADRAMYVVKAGAGEAGPARALPSS